MEKPSTDICTTCSKPQTKSFKLKKCACYSTQYCDKKCQKKDRKAHKEQCLRLLQEKKKQKQKKETEQNTNDKQEAGDGIRMIKQNKEEQEETEDCPICLEALPKLSSQFCRMVCCGKGMHIKCEQDLDASDSLTLKHRNAHKEECLRLVKEKETKDKQTDKKKEMPKQEEENNKEDCPICLEALPTLSSQFARMTCCGKGMHLQCRADLIASKSLTLKQKNECILCRTKIHPKESKERMDQLRHWVQKGKAWGMEMLAHRYREGVGVNQSDQKAVELYEMAAQGGIAGAQFNLGQYYYSGSYGMEQNNKKAVECWTLAAEQGLAQAQLNLGNAYANGEGADQSNELAKGWWRKAAKQGAEQAIKYLEIMKEMENTEMETT